MVVVAGGGGGGGGGRQMATGLRRPGGGGRLAVHLCVGGCACALTFVAFALSGILYHSTDRFLYHPDQPATARVYVPSPSIVGLTFENVYIKSKDSVRLHVFFVKQANEALTSTSPTVLYLHGNAGNIGHRLMNVKGLVQLLGCNVCLLEYRGYGHSDGTPSEEGLYLDAQAGLDFLVGRPDVDPNKIVVFGRSLGTFKVSISQIRILNLFILYII